MQLHSPNDYELQVLARDLFIIRIDSRFQLSSNIAILISLSTGKFAGMNTKFKYSWRLFDTSFVCCLRIGVIVFFCVNWKESMSVETGELRWKSFINDSDHKLSLSHAECLHVFSEDDDSGREKKFKLKTFKIIRASIESK